MSARKGNLWTKEEVFEALQAAYSRGVAFAASQVDLGEDECKRVWEFAPKAAYDYADKATGPDGV